MMKNKHKKEGTISKFTELSRGVIGDNKNIVISKNNFNNNITIAQSVGLNSMGKRIDVFLKGSMIINEIDQLYNLRDTINEAIEKIEDEK